MRLVFLHQCGQGQVKHYQAAKHAVQYLAFQSWCHGHDVTVVLLGKLHMEFAVIDTANIYVMAFTKNIEKSYWLCDNDSDMKTSSQTFISYPLWTRHSYYFPWDLQPGGNLDLLLICKPRFPPSWLSWTLENCFSLETQQSLLRSVNWPGGYI